MLRTLLVCGMLAGACAGLLGTGFASLAGEPAVNASIAFEEASAAPTPGGHDHGAVVSRDLQRSVGLLTASVVYGISIGGLFALAFAAAYGRVVRASPLSTALVLAALAFLVVFLVPFLKYPANPPATGDPDTITRRTLLYLTMIGVSLAAALAALRVWRLALARRGVSAAGAVGLAALVYLVLVVAAGLVLPGVHEVPAAFPATTLWRFREASAGMQLVMWSTLGIVFAVAAQRVMTGRSFWFVRSVA